MSLCSLTCISKLLQFQLLAHSRARNHSCLPLLMLYCSKNCRQVTQCVGLPSFTWGFPFQYELRIVSQRRKFSTCQLDFAYCYSTVPTARKVIDNFIKKGTWIAGWIDCEIFSFSEVKIVICPMFLMTKQCLSVY